MSVSVDCIWGQWAEWTSCSQTCGQGNKTRDRTIKTQAANGGITCTGETREVQTCLVVECPSK